MKYVVQAGDCVASIAASRGFLWQTLWNHPDNADLKQRRGNPNVLLAGDVLVIPDKSQKHVACATDATHVFKVKSATTHLRIRLLEDGQARANLEYELHLGTRVLRGVTDGTGLLDQVIPVTAREATLVTDEHTSKLLLGNLDPSDALSGARQRLSNLGFLHELPGKETDAGMSTAVSEFQHSQQVAETGTLDADTQKLLLSAHGS